MIRILRLLVFFIAFAGFGQNEIAKIDSILKPYQISSAPGMSVGIIKNGEITYSKGFGEANLEYGIKNSDSTVFSLASIAKQFTAACIWTLIKEKKITLDDAIEKHIPEFPHHSQTIKIRHLLNHSSGLSNYHTLMNCKGFDYDSNYYDNQTILDLAIQQKNLNHKPGEKIIYSNTNYTLLTIIIERVSGKKLNDFAKENLFNPLGMNATFVKTENNSLIKNRAVCYQKIEDEFTQNPTIQKSYGAGSMGSTIKDLFNWITVLTGKNEKFKELASFLTTCETLTTGEKAKYARGLQIDQYKNYQTISHSGYGWGGQTQLITIPEVDCPQKVRHYLGVFLWKEKSNMIIHSRLSV
jgi:CubicO group peptidase (beta-lactamase class C family)